MDKELSEEEVEALIKVIDIILDCIAPIIDAYIEVYKRFVACFDLES